MKIGVPAEVKENEDRVGLTPANVEELVNAGHTVLIESHAGDGSGFIDAQYKKAGAEIVNSAEEVWAAEMVVKVKEPLPQEYDYFHDDLILFTYLHLAPEGDLTDALLEKGVTGVAYETMEADGTLPLLTPMSEVAGRMAVQAAANLLEKNNGGPGILLGGVPGVRRANVTVIGGGVVGLNSAKLAYGLGANVTILDVNPQRLAQLENILGNGVQTLMSNEVNIRRAVIDSDVVIGSVLLAGRRAPILVDEDTIKEMNEGSVLIDIAVDQGGNFATTHATTHSNPTFTKHGVIHYAVANIPGAVPRTSTLALTNASFHYAKEIANKGILKAAKENSTIATGINTYKNHLTSEAVAESQDKEYTPLENVLK